MDTYKLKITGWELNGSAHNLTDEQVDDLDNYQDEMGIEDLSDIGYDLEDVLEGYDPFDTNMWNISKPLDISGKTWFTVEDSEGNNVLEFTINDIENIEDVDILHEYETPNQGFPIEFDNENILLFMEENKGLVCDFTFLSDTTPVLEDFSYEPGCIETPDGDWDYVNKVFFKTGELEMEYEEQWVRGKSLTVELWTLDDVE